MSRCNSEPFSSTCDSWSSKWTTKLSGHLLSFVNTRVFCEEQHSTGSNPIITSQRLILVMTTMMCVRGVYNSRDRLATTQPTFQCGLVGPPPIVSEARQQLPKGVSGFSFASRQTAPTREQPLLKPAVVQCCSLWLRVSASYSLSHSLSLLMPREE